MYLQAQKPSQDLFTRGTKQQAMSMHTTARGTWMRQAPIFWTHVPGRWQPCELRQAEAHMGVALAAKDLRLLLQGP